MKLKKSVLNTVVGFTALSVSSIVQAGADCYGRSDCYSNVGPIPIATGTAYGVYSTAGVVFGLQGGYGDNHWNDLFPNISHTGFAGRAYLGFDFARVFGIEAGYVYLPKSSLDDDSITNFAVDLLAKLVVPVTSGFSVYAKAGGSYLHSSPTGVLQDLVGTSHIGPAFGVGASYEIIPNLAIGLDWTRYGGHSKVDDEYQPSPDVVLFGVSYKIPVAFS